jgi:hypothetical protein
MTKQEQLLRDHYAQVSLRLRGIPPAICLVPPTPRPTPPQPQPDKPVKPKRPPTLRTRREIALAQLWSIEQLAKLYELYHMGEPWEVIAQATGHYQTSCQKVVSAMKLQRYLKVKKNLKVKNHVKP